MNIGLSHLSCVFPLSWLVPKLIYGHLMAFFLLNIAKTCSLYNPLHILSRLQKKKFFLLYKSLNFKLTRPPVVYLVKCYTCKK